MKHSVSITGLGALDLPEGSGCIVPFVDALLICRSSLQSYEKISRISV